MNEAEKVRNEHRKNGTLTRVRLTLNSQKNDIIAGIACMTALIFSSFADLTFKTRPLIRFVNLPLRLFMPKIELGR